MCTETETPISNKKVEHRGGTLRFLITTRRAKSVVIIKLKQWMKKLKNIEEKSRDGGAVQTESLKMNCDGVLIEHENASNENKFNIVKSKMAYTVEELRDIVDDNLANELKEIRSKSAQE